MIPGTAFGLTHGCYFRVAYGALEKATVAVKKEVRGAVKEGQDGGQNSGDAGGSHGVARQASLGGSDGMSVPKKTYSEAEKTACSIEAMRNGETCEACQ